MESDETLVRAVQEGFISKFSVLVDRYERKLYHFVSQKIRRHQEVEDIVQDTFIKVYKCIHTVDVEKKFSTFLYTVAKNTMIDFFRRHKPTVNIDRVAEELASEEDIYEIVSEIEQKGVITQVLKALDERYRKVIELYYLHDLSYEEVARKLRIPLGTVRTHLARGKVEFKKLYTTYEPFN